MISAVSTSQTSMRTLIIVALFACPHPALAQDTWFAPDKAKHFGAGAAVAAGGYAIAVPLTTRTRWRVLLGTTAGLGAGTAKELRDRRRGGGSWRDFAWTAGGTAAGTLLAWVIDKATD
jgi:putative lipoprotein